MRKSNQKDLILDIINHSTSHYTAYEIYERCQKVLPNISLGTVYRNLNKMVLNNEIERIKTTEGYDRYDNKIKAHHHFICDKCQKIEDVFEPIALNLNDYDNEITSYSIMFHGICKDCKRKEENYGTKRK